MLFLSHNPAQTWNLKSQKPSHPSFSTFFLAHSQHLPPYSLAPFSSGVRFLLHPPPCSAALHRPPHSAAKPHRPSQSSLTEMARQRWGNGRCRQLPGRNHTIHLWAASSTPPPPALDQAAPWPLLLHKPLATQLLQLHWLVWVWLGFVY